ncbi:MAG TPA: hypothetical protein VFA19_14030 [Gaiellaceae bacterium]|nr:hypothetical protein [Gaiellaceae bacterium]
MSDTGQDLLARSGRTKLVRSVVLTAVLALVAAGGAQAKFVISLHVSPSRPRAGEPVQVVIRAAEFGACRMRLLAVAPGADRYRALDAFINGGYSVMGTAGFSFHRLRPTPRLGFLVVTRRSTATAWRATIRFPRWGRWQLIVPNWCAPGYANPPPAIRVVSVR